MRSRLGALARLVPAVGLLVVGRPLGAEDLLGADFEAFTGIPAAAAEPIDEEEMDDLRGGFLGFYFSVFFSAVADTEGSVDGTLEVNANFGTESGTLSFDGDPSTSGTPAAEGGTLGGPAVTVADQVTGEVFRVQSVIGDAFNGAQGAFQITQSPGNGNDIGQTMILNLAILEATESNLSAVQGRLDSLFGLP